jgi:hypothetical protein
MMPCFGTYEVISQDGQCVECAERGDCIKHERRAQSALSPMMLARLADDSPIETVKPGVFDAGNLGGGDIHEPEKTYQLTVEQIDDLADALAMLDGLVVARRHKAMIHRCHQHLIQALGPDEHLVYAVDHENSPDEDA